MIRLCSCHNQNRHIVNKKYNLCQEGNRDRLSETKSGKKRIDRRKVKDEALDEAYREMDKREKVCSGCGQKANLSRSHLIRRSKNSDLIADPKNIVWDCMERVNEDKFKNKGCHSRWESMVAEEMLTLNNIWDRLEYVKMKEPGLYNIIMDKIKLYYGSN